MPLYAAQQQYKKELEAVRKAEADGALSTDESAAAQMRLTTAFDRQAESLKRSEAGLKNNGYAARQLGLQLNDVFQSVALGMPLTQVALQQGPQIAQIEGLGGAFRSLGALLTPVRLALGTTAAAALVGAAAWGGYLRSTKEVETAAAGLGRAAAGSASEMEAAARAGAAAAGISIREARAMQAQFLRTGRVGSETFEGLIGVSKDFGATLGISATDAGAELAKMFAEPAKAADTLYRKYGLIDAAVARQVTNLVTDETESTQRQRRCNWAALQTLRPEYPLNYTRPLALVALRIKATHQLNGQLDSFNALASRVCLDWDHVTETWILRATSNPASLYRHVLQSPANPKPVSDAGIDLQQLQDWHDFCRISDLAYDRVLDSTDSTLREVLIEIAAAGRASPRHDGVRWGVTVDRPQELVIDHISPRNSKDFKSRRAYVDPPHAFRVKFKDADNDFKDAERLVRWPGYTGEITITEALELPGKTRAHEVWREARRRMYEALHRPDLHQVTQDGPIRVATRGDLVMLSTDVLDQVQMAARVRRVQGNLVELDEVITMQEGQSYGIRFRVYDDLPSYLPPDTIGISVVRAVSTEPGETTVLTLEGSGDLPLAGDLILFGTASSEAYAMIVTGVEAGQDMSSLMRLVDAAPQIDTLLAADEIPAWSGRVGAEIDENLLQPSAPRFVSIVSGVEGTDDPDRIDYLIAPGSGAIQTVSFDVDHRLSGAGSWTTAAIPAADGGGALTVYVGGNLVEMRGRAISPTGVAGPYTPVTSILVGSDDADIPVALASASATALLGGIRVDFAVGSDPAAVQVQVYRSTSATLDRETDAAGAPIPVSAVHSYSTQIGDNRSSLITGGTMESATPWVLGTGWSVASGVAARTAAGVASSIYQTTSLTTGKYYRLGYDAVVSAGQITPRLAGGSTVNGTAHTTSGSHLDRVQAVTGNVNVGWSGNTTFAGSIDNVRIYEETAACLSQGTHYVWLEAQNDDGLPGPVSGPLTVTVV